MSSDFQEVFAVLFDGGAVAMKSIVLSLVFVCVASSQTTLNMSEDLVRLGITSTNVVPNQPDLDAGPLFFRAVIYAQNHQIGRVIVDPGAYYFRSLQYAGSHVGWDGLRNLIIDLQGSDLYFSFPLVSGITITDSTNLVLQNFTADYDPLPFTQVRVISVDAAQRRIRFMVDGTWQNPSLLNAVFDAPKTSFQGIEVHMFRNGRPLAGVPRMNAVNPVGNDQFTIAADPTGYTSSTIIAQIRPGDIAFLGMRLGSGPVSVLHCTGCAFRNMDAYSSTYWGFNIAFAESSVLEHLYSMPRPGTDRLASNYVGLALWSRGPGNQLRFNRLIRTMDAGLESSVGMLGTVRSQTDNRTLLLEGSLTSLLSSGGTPPNGATVIFQRPADGAFLGSAVIVSQIAPPFTGQQNYQATFAFDRDLPTGIVGAVMFGADDSLRGGNAIIERNALEEGTDCCVGFGLYGFTNSAVRGNYIQRSAMAALKVENSLMPGGFNSPPAANLAISNNLIDSTNWIRDVYYGGQLGSIQVDATNAPLLLTTSPNQNISVTNNFVADSGSAAVWLGNTSGGSISGNTLLNSNNNPALESAVSFFGPTQQPIVVQASQNITTANNIVDQTWRRMWVTDGQYRELAAHAPGSTVRLNAYGLATLFPSPSVTLTDADGNAAPLAVQIVTAHGIDVQIPTAAALGAARLTLTSGTLKYFGTLFLDSVDNIPALNGCTYEVSPSSASASAGAGSLPILVVTQAGCPYQVQSTAPYVNPGAGSTGTNVISLGFAANSGAARTTTVEVAGQLFTVMQDAPGAPKPAASIKAIAGNAQSGPAGLPLPTPVVVAVADNLGNPVSRATVTFAATNASVSPAAVQTDSSGLASALVTLGAGLGASNVTATVAGLPAITFNFTATAATTTVTIQKNWQAASAGNPLRGDTFTYSIKVTNSGNAPAAAVNLQDTPATPMELTLQGPVNFNLGTLAPGASQTVTIKAAASAAGRYVNNATVTWSDVTGKSASAVATASTTVDRQPGDLGATLNAVVPLRTGVQQVLADGPTVYVVNNPGDSITILNCTSGACAVSSTVSLGAGAAPVAAVKMDVDGDGQNDIVILNQGSGTIATLLSSSPGAPRVSNLGAGAVALAPLNAGDGIPHVVVIFRGQLTIFVWDGQQFQPGSTVAATLSPSAVVNGDFNRDGVDDLLVADAAAGTVQVFQGDGSGGLKLASTLPVGAGPAALAAGDVNNDGVLDSAVITAAGMVVLLNDGSGNLIPQPVLPALRSGAVALADFDGDGILDAAVANTSGLSVSLYRGDGSGALTPAGSYLTGKAPVSLAASDLDNNGATDLISGDSGSQDLTILLFSNHER